MAYITYTLVDEDALLDEIEERETYNMGFEDGWKMIPPRCPKDETYMLGYFYGKDEREDQIEIDAACK